MKALFDCSVIKNVYLRLNLSPIGGSERLK